MKIKLNQIPAIIAIVFLLMGLVNISNLVYTDQKDLNEKSEIMTQFFADNIATQITNQINLIQNILVNQWLEVTNESQLYSYARYLSIIPSFLNFKSNFLALNWINSTGVIMYVYPYEQNKAVEGFNITHFKSGEFNTALATAKTTKKATASNIIQFVQGGTGIAVYVPIVYNNTITGYFNLVIEISLLIADIFNSVPLISTYSFYLQENISIFYLHNDIFDYKEHFVFHSTINFLQITWELYSHPSAADIRGVSFISHWAILLLILTITGVLFVLSNIIYMQNVALQNEFEEHERLQNAMWQHNKMNALGTMAGSVAHDFNNFLMGIQGQISLIQEVYIKPLEQQLTPQNISLIKLRRNLASVANIINRAKELTSQILSFSRHADTDFTFVNPRTIIEEAVMMAQQSSNKQIEITTYYESEVVVLGNQTKFLQVIVNLVINAIDAIISSGKQNLGHIQVSMFSVPFSLPVETFTQFKQKHPDITFNSTECLLIEIIDNGCGMTQKQQQQVFDPFYTTKSIGKGTGLGLSISQQIIMGFGGFISLKSEEGIGTVVQINLPLTFSDAPPATTVNNELISKFHLAKLQGKTVMIVDDEATIAESLAEHLKSVGINTIALSDSTKAFEQFVDNSINIDFVILDINMPKISGKELYDRMRELKPDLLVIFITGYAEVPPSYILNSKTTILEKPFEIDKLLKVLAQHIKQ